MITHPRKADEFLTRPTSASCARRATLAAHILIAVFGGGTLAVSVVPTGVQVVNKPGPFNAVEVRKTSTMVYDWDKTPTKALLVDLCNDATLFLPRAPEEATFLGNQVAKYWSINQLYTVEGRVSVQGAGNTIVTSNYSCAIVVMPNKGQWKIFVKSNARF